MSGHYRHQDQKGPALVHGRSSHAYTKRVTPTCLVHLERNRYSVPASFANRPVSLRVYALRDEIAKAQTQVKDATDATSAEAVLDNLAIKVKE